MRRWLLSLVLLFFWRPNDCTWRPFTIKKQLFYAECPTWCNHRPWSYHSPHVRGRGLPSMVPREQLRAYLLTVWGIRVSNLSITGLPNLCAFIQTLKITLQKFMQYCKMSYLKYMLSHSQLIRHRSWAWFNLSITSSPSQPLHNPDPPTPFTTCQSYY